MYLNLSFHMLFVCVLNYKYGCTGAYTSTTESTSIIMNMPTLPFVLHSTIVKALDF